MGNAISNPSSSPALVALGNRAIIAAHAALHKAGQFYTDFTADAGSVGSTLRIPILTCAKAAGFDATSNNYASGSESITFASVTFSHKVASFRFTDAQLAEVPRNLFNNCGQAAGISCGIALEDAICSAIKTGSLTGTGLTVPHAGTLSKEDIATLAGGCITNAARCVLALNKTYFAKAAALFDAAVYGGPDCVRYGVLDAGVLGFKSIICLDDAMPTNTVGLLIPEDAVAAASRIVPIDAPAAYAEVGTVADEESGFTFGLRRGVEVTTGANFIAVETLVGAAVAQGAKIQKVTVAAS